VEEVNMLAVIAQLFQVAVAPRRHHFEPLYCAWCGIEIGEEHTNDCPNVDRYIADDDYDVQLRRRFCEITGMRRAECDCEFCRRWLS
jgi:hypothetical protein